MQKIDAGYKYYNANSRAIHTEDCVKRALSIAYKMDYDQVSKELNILKRKMGYEQFNVTPVFSRFIAERGAVQYGNYREFNIPPNTTVADFCETHNVGTYVLSVGKTHQHSDHLVCVSCSK